MMNKKKSSEFELLRQKTEELLNNKPSTAKAQVLGTEILNFIRDAEVRHLELEFQIEELIQGKEVKKNAEFLSSGEDNTEHKTVKGKLGYNEEQFRFLTENSQDMIYRMALPSGNYEYVSPAANQIFGYSPEEFIDTPFLIKKALHPNWLKYFEEQWDLIFSGGMPAFYEYQIIHGKSKETRWLNQRNSLIKNLQGEPIAMEGVVTDITDRKKAEEKLKEGEELLRGIVENSLNAIVVANDQGYYTLVNDAAANMFGYSCEEMLKMHVGQINTISDPSAAKKYKLYLEKGQEIGEFEFLSSSGKQRTAQYHAVRVRDNFNLSILSDITDRKLAEKALAESEEKFYRVFDKSPIAISLIDSNRNFVDVNNAFKKMLGYSETEMIGQNIDNLNMIVDTESDTELNRQLEDGGMVDSSIVKYQKKDGSIGWAILSGELINISGRQHVLSMMIDITERKEAEEIIKESRSNLVSLINNTEDSIWSLDRNYNYLIFNKAYADIFLNEYGIEVKKGMNAKKFLKPEEFDFWVSLCESVFQGEKKTFEFSHDFSGNTHYFQTSMNPIYKDDIVTGLSAMSIDITDVKVAEQKVAISNERYKTLFNDSPVPLWEEDFTELVSYLEGLKNNGILNLLEYFDKNPDEIITCARKIKILDLNQAVLGLHMAQSKEELLDSLDKTFTDKSYEVFKEEVIAISEGKNEFTLEGEVKTLTGELRYIYLRFKIDQSNPDIKRALVSTSDITSRKLAEDKIKLSEFKFRSIFEESTDGLMLLDEHSNPLEVNTKICELLGYSKEELMSINATAHIHPEDTKGVHYEDALEKLLSGESIYANYRIRKKDESYIFIEIGVKMLENGQFLNIIRDISERIKLEKAAQLAQEEVKKMNEELEQKVHERTAQLEAANKELETFTYSVSHDLKAPLRGIDGYSKLLQDSYQNKQNEEVQLFLKNIRDSTFKMNQLIDDLLEYSQLERSHMHMEKIRIKDLINTIASNFKDKLQEGNFKLQVDINDSLIEGDSKGLTIALRNLLENAIKFTFGRENPSIKISIEEKSSSWILLVSDNGIGFDVKYVHKIFNIFQRLHRAEDFSGTGIGLALVSKAMQRMKGRVWAESLPNTGSTFYLEIPKP